MNHDFWSNFWIFFWWGVFLFPFPLGYLWIWLYRKRKNFNLPDWFSGILAQGIISGHNISNDVAKNYDYLFIVKSTLILIILISFILALVF